MSRVIWRTRLVRRGIPPALQSWLTEPGSLTARCQSRCEKFMVKVLHYGYSRALADEGRGGRQVRVREVLLSCDGVPVIFAHTSLCTAPCKKHPWGVALSNLPAGQSRGPLSRWLARLGSRSLGSLLFAHPGFQRGEIEYCRLDARHPLFQRVAEVCPLPGQLWARRSRHSLGGQTVLVTEVFLPAIETL